MVKLTILCGEPSNPTAFEEQYARHVTDYIEHGDIPGLVRFDAAKALAAPTGKPPFYRTADLWFESLDALQAARGLERWQAGIKDLTSFSDGGLQVLVCTVDIKELAPAPG